MDDPPDRFAPGDLRRAAAYGRRRAAWELALDDPMSLLEAGIATRRFVRAVVDRSLHRSTDPDGSRWLPHGAEVAALDDALGVIFGNALRPGLFEEYLGQLAFGEQLRTYLGEWIGDALLLPPALFRSFAADPAPYERLRAEFAARFAAGLGPDTHCFAKQGLIEALDAAGLEPWARGVRDGDFRRVCRRPDPDDAGGPAGPEPEEGPAP